MASVLSSIKLKAGTTSAFLSVEIADGDASAAHPISQKAILSVRMHMRTRHDRFLVLAVHQRP